MFVPAQAPAAATAGPDAPPVEEFDCAEGGLVGDLKAMLRQRTRLPAERMVLLLGGARLHDGLPLAHLAAAGPGTAALVLHLQLAAGGVHLLVRREGQGHREPRGPCRLTLRLPPGVRGARQRPLAVDPGQSFGDLCRDVQAASGLAPAGMLLELLAPSGGRQLLGARRTDHASTLAELGIRDGCEARVWHAAEELCPASPFDVGVDVAPAGQGQELYAEVARQLGVADAAGLALYAGGAALPREQGLSGLADGMVLSAFGGGR
ncbi:unnamed protein product [Prorocentrum cordatum]|uniref:Ubiquitin-like domain-containing protein n=1 Tax=Prorocentrum cordatum TaxID=2364126 RepID=A0ABN9TEI2_9DINO|nr:unnamed protein product [Polarella glacialis]